MNIVIVLPAVVIPKDGIYKVKTLNSIPDIAGVPHLLSHSNTRKLAECLGATSPADRKFIGLDIGEAAVCMIQTDDEGCHVRTVERLG